MIRIVGGIGPYAGIDLLKNIFDNTLAKKYFFKKALIFFKRGYPNRK